MAGASMGNSLALTSDRDPCAILMQPLKKWKHVWFFHNSVAEVQHVFHLGVCFDPDELVLLQNIRAPTHLESQSNQTTLILGTPSARNAQQICGQWHSFCDRFKARWKWRTSCIVKESRDLLVSMLPLLTCGEFLHSDRIWGQIVIPCFKYTSSFSKYWLLDLYLENVHETPISIY